MLQSGSKNRLNLYMQAMCLAMITKSARKNSTSEYMLELVGP